jgi:hypothetical protein
MTLHRWCFVAALRQAMFSAVIVVGANAQSVWQSEGYGRVVQMVGDSMRAYELTRVSCLATDGAHRVDVAADGAETLAGDADADVAIVIRAGRDTNERRYHYEGAASDIILHRIPALPALCDNPVSNDAATVFDIFWETYHEQYPFFALRHVDWQAARDRYRPQATTASSPAALFGVLRAMIEPLHDAHTFVAAPRDTTLGYNGFRPDPDPVRMAGRARVKEIIATRYLTTPLRVWANGAIAYGMLPDSTAYIRITRFEEYVAHGGYREDRDTLEAALDAIFGDTHAWRGLIIDVRLNGGGADPLGLAIAARLTTAPYIAYAKVARNDLDDPHRMTAPQPNVVTPSSRPGWRGPVVELTSRYSVSAAETFTQALMGRRPAIERIGENTQGVFSDVLERHLPNGWVFGLPNELFLTAQGTSFDGTGVPPTIAVPTFVKADLDAGRDPGLERAIARLRVISDQRP